MKALRICPSIRPSARLAEITVCVISEEQTVQQIHAEFRRYHRYISKQGQSHGKVNARKNLQPVARLLRNTDTGDSFR